MRKTQVALAALALVASTAALADVKLYGSMDASVVRTSQGTTMAGAGNNTGSIYGFAGTSDLGSGLKAGFTLEGGIDLANGTAANGGTSAQGFNRQTFVSVGSDAVTVSAGMKISPFIAGSLVGAANIGGNGVFVPGLLRLTGGNLAAVNGSQNSGGFFTPDAITVDANFAGISASVQHRVAQTNDSYLAASATTSLGGVNVALAYQKKETTANVETTNTVLAANTKLGEVTLNGAVGNGSGTNAGNGYVIGASMPLMAGLEGGLYYAYSSVATLRGQTSASLKYSLSPSTFTYLTYSSFGRSGGVATVANSAPNLTNNADNALILGVAHSF